MTENFKNRAGAIAVKYNIGWRTLIQTLKHEGFTEAKEKPGYILSKEELHVIDSAFAENLKLKQSVSEMRSEEMLEKTVGLIPFFVELLKLNEKLTSASYFNLPWKEKEVKELVKQYIDSIPQTILDKIKTNELVDQSIFDKIETFLKKKDKITIGNNFDLNIDLRHKRQYDYDDGPYCSACMQAPCMCSDRERSSTTYDF